MGLFGKKKHDPGEGITVEMVKVPDAPTSAPVPAPPAAANYSTMPLADLLAIKKTIDDEFAKRRDEVYGNVTMQLETFGLSLDEVKQKKKKRNFPVKYRDPENPENTWSGMGKPKKWLQNYLDQGRALEDFAVPGTDA